MTSKQNRFKNNPNKVGKKSRDNRALVNRPKKKLSSGETLFLLSAYLRHMTMNTNFMETMVRVTRYFLVNGNLEYNH